MIGISVALASTLCSQSVHTQTATVPNRPSDTVILPEPSYPDAVVCDITSPDGITYRTVFYKSQTISFANQQNNAAEYGTTFMREVDRPDRASATRWRLQLGKPGNITVFALPADWLNVNCPVGKTIERLRADKQLMKLFAVE